MITILGTLVKASLKKSIKMKAVKYTVKHGLPVAKKVGKKAYNHFIVKE